MAVPAAIAVTSPDELIVATVAGAQLHAPPGSELVRVIVLPGHTGTLPVTMPGKPFTVTVAVTVPQVVAYETTAVPAAIAVTTPDELIVAIADGVMLQVPPGNEFVKVRELPAHTAAAPVMGPGKLFTVTVAVTVPQVVT
jgi:hypothetical protein